MKDITTIIAAYGNNPHLFNCIDSVYDISKKIILLDMGIEDDLNKIKKYKNLKIKKIDRVSHIELIREDSKKYADTEYILFLDPDEILEKSLKKEILSVYKDYDALRIPRKNIIFNKWIKNTRWWPDYQTRLFKKERVFWKKEIHSQPEIKGSVYNISENGALAIKHYNYNNLDEFLEKMKRYAKADAESRLKNKQEYTLSKALSQGIQEFISRYFAGDGYKNGMHGFLLSFLQLMYYPLVYFYLWEKENYKDIDRQEIISDTEFFSKKLFREVNYWSIKKNLKTKTPKIKKKIINKLLK